MDKISVIVPIYNAENTLDKCIQSILSQTYKNLELILVNDGSTDNSFTLCQKWESADDRVFVVSKNNEGLPYARKTGLENITGDYVLFVDSDDWIDKEMLAYMHHLMVEHQADIAMCKLVKDYPNGKKELLSKVDSLTIYTAEEAIEAINYNKIEASLCNKLFKTTLLKNLNFAKEVTIGEDYRITWQTIRNAQKLIYVPQVFYHYIQDSESMVHKGYANNGFCIINNYTFIRDEMILTFPQIAASAISYWFLQEMAIIISMIRGNYFDQEVIQQVKKDTKKYYFKYISNGKVPLYLKVCATLLCIHEKMLIVPYRCFFSWRDKL